MKTEITQSEKKDALHRCVEVLQNGGLVVFPTDTVYGVAAWPWNEEAVARLYQVKKRPPEKAIPLLLSDAEQISRVAAMPPGVERLAARFWPGGLTLVLPKAESVSHRISAGSTVAVRVPGLPLARSMIRAAGGVLAVTSANISGQPSPVTAQEAAEQLSGQVELILDGGPCPVGVPSTLLDCTVTPPALLRRGAVSEQDLRAILGALEIPSQKNP